jgi:hypothetical protein
VVVVLNGARWRGIDPPRHVVMEIMTHRGGVDPPRRVVTDVMEIATHREGVDPPRHVVTEIVTR